MSNQSNFDDPNSFFDRVLTGSSNQAQFWSRRSFWGSILMTLAILVLVSVIWLSYIGAPDKSPEDQLPIVRANTNAVRTAPDEPGGMDIQNRDSTVFNAFNQETPAVPKIENLLEDKGVETIDREALMAENEIDLNDPDAVRESMLRKAEEHVQALKEKEEQAELPTRGEFPEPSGEETTPEETLEYVRSVLERKDVKTIHPVEDTPTPSVKDPIKVKTEPTPTPPPTQKAKIERTTVVTAPVSRPKASSTPNHYVQLGSFKSQSAAQDQWAKMKKDFPTLFKGLTLKVQRADLGAKGIYYRVQAGKFAENQAKSVCKTLNGKRSGSCLVVKP